MSEVESRGTFLRRGEQRPSAFIGRLPAWTPELAKLNAHVAPIAAAAGRYRKRPITSGRFDPPCTAPRIPSAPPAASTAIDSHQPADAPPRPPDHPNQPR